MISQFLISAPYSSAGKTTVTLGLLRALRRKGHIVQPFKCGPDFIDPIHHRDAAGRDSINLDRYMMSDGHIRELYRSYTADADVAITEGVMGLFDGAVKSEGSAADLSKLLDIPILLLLDARAMGYSAAALLYGLRRFDPDLRLTGVLFNFVGSEGHYRLLREAAVDAGVVPLGYLPEIPGLHIPSRHLGLDTTQAETVMEAAADELEKRVDLDELLRVTHTGIEPLPDLRRCPIATEAAPTPTSKSLSILIAKDPAFHFLYPENIRRLEELGAIHYFSPLKDRGLPIKPGLIYLPGGYPELYLPELAANTALLEQLRSYAAEGGKILAECGGMMYLGRSITDGSGVSWEMAGITEAQTTIQQQRLSLGYRTMSLPGGMARGHEFHYSRFIGPPTACWSPNVLASYMHFYWGEDRQFLEHWLAS